MSLFGGLFKNRGSKKPAPQKKEIRRAPVMPPRRTTPPKPSTAAKPAPVAPPPPASPPPPAASQAPAPDIEEIQKQLKEIEQIIGPGAYDGMGGGGADDLVALEISLQEVIDLIPPTLLRPGRSLPESPTHVVVLIEDVFTQLAKGRVVTTLGRLTSEVPETLLASDVEEHSDDLVALPLPLVVSSIKPEELQKRTSRQERNLGLRELPNLFSKEGEPAPVGMVEPEAAASAEAEAPVAEAVPEPVAAEPEPVAEEPEPVVEEDVAAAEPEPEPVVEEQVVAAEPEPVPVEEEEVAVPEPEPIPVPKPAPVPPKPLKIKQKPAAAPKPPPVVPKPVPVVPAPPPAAPKPPPAIKKPLVQIPAPQEAPAPQPVAVRVPDGIEEGAYLFLRGLDLNRATVADLIERLDGVGPRLAERMVRDRELNGPFFYLSDLARVPGLGRKTFEQITGLPMRLSIFRYLGVVQKVLGRAPNGMPDIRGVASRFKELDGFDGCILAHGDGYLLSSNWASEKSEAFGAFAPQMYKKVGPYLRQLDLGGIGSITFFLEDTPFTLVRSGEIYLIAVHQPARFSRKHVHIAQAIGAELGRRLSRTHLPGEGGDDQAPQDELPA